MKLQLLWINCDRVRIAFYEQAYSQMKAILPQRCNNDVQKEQDFLMIFGQFFKSVQKILKMQTKKQANTQKQMK